MTTAEAAKKLGMSDRHVRQLIRNGELTARQENARGTVYFLLPTELERFRQKRAKEAAALQKQTKKPVGRPKRVPEKKDGEAE